MPIAKKKVTVYRTFSSFRGRNRRFHGAETNGRQAERRAKRIARKRHAGAFPRQVSVYRVPPGQSRGKLIHQFHFSAKLGRLVHEEL